MKQRRRLISISVGLLATLVGPWLPELRAATSAANIAKALDAPAGITFSAASGGWELKTGNVSGANLSGITSVNKNYLVANAPGKANPRGSHSFTLSCKGAGTLSFKYKVSLEDLNWSELVLYDGDYDTGYLWSADGWWAKDEADIDDNGKWDPEEDMDWWEEGRVYLGTATYSRTLTFSLYGPSSVEYETPELDKEWGDVLYKRAWLDSFVWEPDAGVDMLEFKTEPVDVTVFNDQLSVSLVPAYGNFTVYFTTDGSTPSTQSQLYKQPIAITKTTTFKAVVYEGSQRIGNTVYSATFTKKTSSPELGFVAGTFAVSSQVLFSSGTAGAEFYYTLNGGTPQVNGDGTPGAGTYRGASYTLRDSTQIAVMAVAPGAANSEVVTQSYTKLSPPTLSCQLDGQAYGEPAVFDRQARVTLSGPAGAALWYNINAGAEQLYGAALTLSSSTTITAQARQEGKISSEPVSIQVTKSTGTVTLPAVDGAGWRIFSLPGEVSQATSDRIISAWQPIAYDAQRRVYAKASRIRGGQGYWIFGAKAALGDVAYAPMANSVRTGSWQLVGGAQMSTLSPGSYLADRWDNAQGRFVTANAKDVPELGGLWLYYFGATK